MTFASQKDFEMAVAAVKKKIQAGNELTDIEKTIKKEFVDGGNFTVERVVAQDKIAEGILKVATPVENPVVTMLGGGIESGKSTLVASGFLDIGNAVRIDTDYIKTQIPEFEQMVEAGDHNAAMYVDAESCDIAMQAMREALDRKLNIVLDGIWEDTYDKLSLRVAECRSHGATKVVAEYVNRPVREALAHSKESSEQTGIYVPEKIMRASHASVARIFPRAVKEGLFDEARLWDNTGGKGVPVKVMEHKRGKTTIYDKARWDTFVNKAKGYYRNERKDEHTNGVEATEQHANENKKTLIGMIGGKAMADGDALIRFAEKVTGKKASPEDAQKLRDTAARIAEGQAAFALLTPEQKQAHQEAALQKARDNAPKQIPKTTYYYLIIDGDTLARIELSDGKMTVNGAELREGVWFPIFPFDILWWGRELTAHELSTLVKDYPVSTKKIDTSRWANENWVGKSPEEILGVARGAYKEFYEANS